MCVCIVYTRELALLLAGPTGYCYIICKTKITFPSASTGIHDCVYVLVKKAALHIYAA